MTKQSQESEPPKLNLNLLTEGDLIAIDAEACRRSFYTFLQEFWFAVIPEDPVWNWHMKYLCGELQTMVQRVAQRLDKEYDLIINIPPGTSKSTICTVMLPVWAWVIDPSIRSMTSSYSGALSADHSTKSRDIIKSDKFKAYFPDIKIRKDIDGKTHYKNLEGGERFATSVAGTMTGFHAHLLIVDDPLNPKEASSEVERMRANQFMDVTLSTRKVNKSVTPTILVMQRLHKNDCTGNLLENRSDFVKHICLPGEVSQDIQPPELKERYVDGLLDPVRLSGKNLSELKKSLGSYGYAGQIMQTPSPLDGGIWQKWFVAIPDADFPKFGEMTQYGSDWDLAYTKDETNSATAYVCSGKVGEAMYIDQIGFEWLEFPEMITYMKSKPQPHYIEAKASGKSAKQTLVKQGIPAVEVGVQGGDKIARAMLATPYAEAGLIYIRTSLVERLYYDSKQGILIFPNGEGDDLQDALVQAINRHLGKPSFFVV